MMRETTMNKMILSAGAILSAITFAPAAQAAPIIVITGASGTFGDDTVSADLAGGVINPIPGASGAFTRTFNFLTPVGFNLTSIDISSVLVGSSNLTNIDFSSVTLNGIAFNILSTGVQEFRNLLNQSLTTGALNTLVVNGTTGGDAAFSGNLSFASVSAVPEPSTWAFMLVGFGAVGYSMRKRPSGKISYKMAQAV